ncbi:MAG: hypothetical protein OXR07_06640 [Nitrospira sp.]|nr:hypothetical protein [Nitrospira sp.]
MGNDVDASIQAGSGFYRSRLEHLYDKSNKDSFWDGYVYGNNQSTLAVEAIYLFNGMWCG